MIHNMRSSESIVVRIVLRVLYGMCVIVRVYGRTCICLKKKRIVFFSTDDSTPAGESPYTQQVGSNVCQREYYIIIHRYIHITLSVTLLSHRQVKYKTRSPATKCIPIYEYTCKDYIMYRMPLFYDNNAFTTRSCFFRSTPQFPVGTENSRNRYSSDFLIESFDVCRFDIVIWF